MATVGNTDIEANEATVPTNQMTGFRFQASGSFTAQSMYLYVLSTWAAGRKAVFGIYSDAATLPDTLLGQTAETTSTGTNEWHGVDLQSGVSIVSGSWYWLAAHANANLLYRRVGSTGKMANENVGSYSATMPATFTESLVITQNGSIYASSSAVPSGTAAAITGNVIGNPSPTTSPLANLSPVANVLSNPSPSEEVYSA